MSIFPWISCPCQNRLILLRTVRQARYKHMKPLLVNPRALELHIQGDGQRFTTLIRSWAGVYLRRCGGSGFSINGVAWRPDGGVDGLINDSGLKEPLDWFAPKTAMQFKVGTSAVSEAKAELLAEAPDGKERIRDKIAEGFRVVWFIGRTLVDLERQAFEDALAEAVASVNTEAPRPVVIDINRLAELISLTPAVALQVATNPGLFMTTDAAIRESPHNLLPNFVPGSHYPQLQQDVISFFLGSTDSEPVKYIAGEPGIGKSRSILEAVESSDELRGTVSYFVDPSRVGAFLTLAKQEAWRGYAIVDEFIGESASATPINSSTVPSGFKILLIGHAYATDRLSPRVTNRLEPLTEDEVQKALAATFSDLQEFRIREAVQMSKDNIRLARLICAYYSRNPDSAGLDASSLSQIVAEELERMPAGQDVLKRLALLPNLLAEETSAFCKLVESDEDSFRKTCRQVSASSALIQFNDHVAYIGSPAVAQLALMRFWNEDLDLARRVLANPGQFAERILIAINKLPACAEKDGMLGFFTLPTAKLKLNDLLDQSTGRRFLNLLTADPDIYLPVLHRLVMDARGHLEEFPYEGTQVGRRDIVWRVRELAQFAEYFELSEEIVYALAREEARSAYSNIASSYWVSWFHSYFDHTVYPYEKRLDLLEQRARDGDDLDQAFAIRAVADPFPHHGDMIPSSRVGGRVAPPELNFIHYRQVQLAADRIPNIVKVLLSSPAQSTVELAVKVVLDSRFSWLEHGAFDQYVQIVTDPSFPADARKRLVADTRQYVDLASDRSVAPDERVRWMHAQNKRLLDVIDDPDPLITVLEVAAHGMWRGEEPGTAANTKLTTLLKQCFNDPDLFDKAVAILSDPQKTGGGTFGRLLGAEVNDDQLRAILVRVRSVGLSQFTYSALSAAAKADPNRQQVLLSFASERESEQPHVAISIYQLFGDETYFREAARMLSTTDVPANLFRGFFVRSKEDLPDTVWEFVAAVAERAATGEAHAVEVLGTIAGEFGRNDVADERAYAVGLPALENTPSDRSLNALAEWSEVAVWLYRRYPKEVIRLAASREQSEFSEATTALAEIAKIEPETVLDALIPKLKAPYESPFLFNGALLRVMQNIPLAVFEPWVKKQDPEVLETVAGHLPKPYLDGGKAFVPPLTRKFWEICTEDLGETYAHAQSAFGAHTFNTGVYTGHGIELFTARVEIGRQLRNDTTPGIREWAEDFVRQSDAMLERGIRDARLDEARRVTGD
jgi:hypothetical protein